MTKRQFINQLSYHLSQLSSEERKEIISFYEDRFSNAIFEGKSEEDIISELETPEEIARNVLMEYGIEKRVREQRVEPASIIGLVFFDLFVSSWLIPVSFAVSGSLFVSWFSYFTVFGAFATQPFGTALAITLIVTAVFALYLVFIIYLVAGATKLVLSIVAWHVRVFSPRNPALAEQITSFNVFEYLAKIKITHKLLGFIALGAAVVSISGITIWRATAKPVQTEETIIETYTYDVAQLEDYTLDVVLANARIEILYGETDQVVVEHINNSEAEVTYTEITNGLEVLDKTRTTIWDNTTGIDFIIQFLNRDFETFNDSMTIYIPEGMTFETLELETANGQIEVDGIEANALILETVNGELTLTESTASSVRLMTVNGATTVQDVFADSVTIEGVNGEIDIDDLNNADNDGSRLDIDLVNGEITINDAYFKIVSVDNVNGNITYTNTDHSYVADRIDLETVNGKESSNVAH